MRKSLLAVCLFISSADLVAKEPDLPLGLVIEKSEPDLPFGIDSTASYIAKDSNANIHDVTITGFVEARAGMRMQNDSYQKDSSLGEARAELSLERQSDFITSKITADFVYDPVMDKYAVDLENGDGVLDLREANFVFRPISNVDTKIGRQILTWGTGDLLFINDLFPKDWNSFFIGRDDEYLKAPSDSLKTSIYTDLLNLDLVYTPKFSGDRFIDGRRLSYYNANSGTLAGRNDIIITDERDHYFVNDEVALRAYKNINLTEFSFYYYRGYWQTPEGYNMNSGLYEYPRLQEYGASARRPLAGGIANFEIGYYDSLDDRAGNDALIRNSEFRALTGFEREIATNLTAGMQYYLENMQDYDAYKDNLPAGSYVKSEYRQLATLRLTKLLMQQNLILSLFNFYSPTDEDGYLRFRATYKFDDNMRGEIGGNYFFGNAAESFFGQFEDASNLYLGLRYSF